MVRNLPKKHLHVRGDSAAAAAAAMLVLLHKVCITDCPVSYRLTTALCRAIGCTVHTLESRNKSPPQNQKPKPNTLPLTRYVHSLHSLSSTRHPQHHQAKIIFCARLDFLTFLLITLGRIGKTIPQEKLKLTTFPHIQNTRRASI